MICPVCGEKMSVYKEHTSYSQKKRLEYKRTYYRCERDDTWGRLEVPVGPMKENTHQPEPVHPS